MPKVSSDLEKELSCEVVGAKEFFTDEIQKVGLGTTAYWVDPGFFGSTKHCAHFSPTKNADPKSESRFSSENRLELSSKMTFLAPGDSLTMTHFLIFF